jgi:acetolactate synthase-1/2/3 large subunit
LDALKQAERPVFLAGNGIRTAGAKDELRSVVEKYEIPTVFTRPSVDLLPYQHELHFGVVSAAAANRYANFIIQNSDLIISVGSRLSIETTGPEQKDFGREAKIIVVDIDSIEHKKNGVTVSKYIQADAKNFLRAMYEADAAGSTWQEWLRICNHWKQIFPGYVYEEAKQKNPINIKYFLEQLSEILPNDVTVISDAGLTGSTVPANCHVGAGGRFMLTHRGRWGLSCRLPSGYRMQRIIWL